MSSSIAGLFVYSVVVAIGYRVCFIHWRDYRLDNGQEKVTC